MGHPPTKADEVEQRRSIVADRLINGWSGRRIAQELGVTHTTIQGDIAAIRSQWAENQTHSYAEWVARELERLDYLESKIAHRIDTGDTNAIQIGLRIQERRAKYLALDSPTRVVIEDALSAEIRELAEQVGQLDNPLVREIVSGIQS